MAIYSRFTHWTWRFSIVVLVYQRVSHTNIGMEWIAPQPTFLPATHATSCSPSLPSVTTRSPLPATCNNNVIPAGKAGKDTKTHVGFHKWGYPIAGWFIRENPIKMDDLGVNLFQETSIWTITIFNGQIKYKWPFSIAFWCFLYVYQRVKLPWESSSFAWNINIFWNIQHGYWTYMNNQHVEVFQHYILADQAGLLAVFLGSEVSASSFSKVTCLILVGGWGYPPLWKMMEFVKIKGWLT